MKRAGTVARMDAEKDAVETVGEMVAGIVALRDSLVGVERDEAGESWRELEGRIRRLRKWLASRGDDWTLEEAQADALLDDLESPILLLWDSGAVYTDRLLPAFVRIGAGEDAAAVFGECREKVEKWAERTARVARWHKSNVPRSIEAFGVLVGMMGWLCGEPAGEWAKSDYLWEALEVFSLDLPGSCDGAVRPGTLELMETSAGMGEKARRVLAMGLATECAYLGKEANLTARQIVRDEETKKQIAEAEAREEEAKAEMYKAQGRADAEAAARGRAETKWKEAEAARQREAEARAMMEGKMNVLREMAEGKMEGLGRKMDVVSADVKAVKHAAAGAWAEAAHGRVAAERTGETVRTEGQKAREQAERNHAETQKAVKGLVDKDKRARDFVAACVEFYGEIGDESPRGKIARAHAKDWFPDARKRFDLGNTKSVIRWLDRYSEWFYDLGKPGTLEDYRAKQKTMRARK